MPLPEFVKIVEVSPRDGLQNEPSTIPTELKVQLINALSNTGLKQIETTSFVSPKWVPQMSDHSEVVTKITPTKGVDYVALIPNEQGYIEAKDAGVKHIAVFSAASETFSQKNANCSIIESLSRIEDIIELAQKDNTPVRGYLSCVMGCPYEGDVNVEQVVRVANTLFEMGCNEISLGDTIGVGTPIKTKQLIDAVAQYIPKQNLAVHFHDTYGQALANIYTALERGISIVDASVAGLGGCPYAPGAGGNVATEDVVFLCDGLGIATGIDILALTAAGKIITGHLGTAPHSKAAVALQSAKYRTISN